jgi:hypothetical protein
MERINPKKSNESEGKEQYYVEVSNRFTSSEHLGTEVDSNSAWKNYIENINILAKESLGYYELKKHKPWFDKGCSKLLYQSKQVKLQWLQGPREINEENLNNIRCDASRHFRNKKREYLTVKVNESATNLEVM